MYEVVIPRKVEKTLAKFSEELRERLTHAIYDLSENPRPRGCKKLEASEKYRIAVGDYRIIYDIADKIRIVTIIKIGHRKEVYRP
jgi:mRNA interferase RelE/StbE